MFTNDAEFAEVCWKWIRELDGVSDEELRAVLTVVGQLLIVPNAYDAEKLKSLLGLDELTKEQFDLFHRFVWLSNCMNMVDDEMDYLWHEMVDGHEDEDGQVDWGKVEASVEESERSRKAWNKESEETLGRSQEVSVEDAHDE